jgi:predicted amidohydrolase YtcJ
MVANQKTLLNHVGPKRAPFLYAAETLTKRGIQIALGTGWPDYVLNPFLSIYALTTRMSSEGVMTKGWNHHERLPLENVLKSFAFGGAFAAHENHYKGSIREGKCADLIVLDNDPYKEKGLSLTKISVVMTLSNGRIVYNRLN